MLWKFFQFESSGTICPDVCLSNVSCTVHRCRNYGLANCFRTEKSVLSPLWPARCCPEGCNASTMCLSRLAYSILHAVSSTCQVGHEQGCSRHVERGNHTRRKEAKRRKRIRRIKSLTENKINVHDYPFPRPLHVCLRTLSWEALSYLPISKLYRLYISHQCMCILLLTWWICLDLLILLFGI